MRSLFLKIFVSFWVAQALFVVLAIALAVWLRPQRETAVWDALEAKVLNESVESYQNSGAEGVGRYLSDLQNTQHVRAFLFDEDGSTSRAKDATRPGTSNCGTRERRAVSCASPVSQ